MGNRLDGEVGRAMNKALFRGAEITFDRFRRLRRSIGSRLNKSIAGLETLPTKLTQWYLRLLGQSTDKPSGKARFTDSVSTPAIQRGMPFDHPQNSTTQMPLLMAVESAQPDSIAPRDWRPPDVFNRRWVPAEIMRGRYRADSKREHMEAKLARHDSVVCVRVF
jgi:hypothetical protein